jgi:hypothetical protein
MTAPQTDRVMNVMDRICEIQPGVDGSIELIRRTIVAAVAEEREACAKIADGMPFEGYMFRAPVIADAIRARGH